MELANLKWGDLKEVGGRWMVTVKGKGGDNAGEKRNRYFEIPKSIVDKMQTHSRRIYRQTRETDPGEADPIFIHNRNGNAIIYFTLVKQWKKVLGDLKIDTASHGIHSLRRYACAYLYEKSGFNERYVRSVCGWDSDAINYYISPEQRVTKSVLEQIADDFSG